MLGDRGGMAGLEGTSSQLERATPWLEVWQLQLLSWTCWLSSMAPAWIPQHKPLPPLLVRGQPLIQSRITLGPQISPEPLIQPVYQGEVWHREVWRARPERDPGKVVYWGATARRPGGPPYSRLCTLLGRNIACFPYFALPFSTTPLYFSLSPSVFFSF